MGSAEVGEVKVDRRKLRKKSEKKRSRPKPHRSVLKMRREAGKKAWKAVKAKGNHNIEGRRSRAGVPDGMRTAEAEVAWAAARVSAKETIAKMIENKIIEPSDDQRANEALEVAMTIMKGPSAHQAEKLRAARVVLEWTRAKPAAKSEVTIQKAEDWRLSQSTGKKGLVVAHKADSTRTLFDMYQRYHSLCPPMLKPSTKFSSRKELVFDKLDTGIMVATAGGDGIARSETLTHAHLSELAFWPSGTANENLNALLQCIPNTDDTEVFIESTACGFNEFHKLWAGAVKGENEFIPFFAAWFETAEYREKAPEDFERTLEEEDLVAKHGLDNDQLLWRRRKVAANGRAMFQQEYPCTPEEAFISSGRPVFNPEQINELLQSAPEPLYRMAVEESPAGMSMHKHPAGELFVYKELDNGETYCIGADVGMGVRDGDWSVAHVLDGNKEVVATWRGQVHPDYYASVLSTLGLYYNTALLAPESNNHGILTCVKLYKDLAYPNVFIDLQEGQIEDKDTINVGFRTTTKTRPLIIDRLRGALRERDITVNDATSLREMLTFVVNEAGKMEAEAGCHDDCVMALAIANHVHPGRFMPIEVSEEHYVATV